ncbi:hypothetical protein Y1Q_0001064 [Alligator mississippiensis]|uniref:Uncharacterized protein n=1 Tax=Alligator mississippiensis TaxID=8496 RepID=A0A151NF66_ALLMI|nr:hypothetical protein Y1Q_0001064 [Alligator mississippiensis]
MSAEDLEESSVELLTQIKVLRNVTVGFLVLSSEVKNGSLKLGRSEFVPRPARFPARLWNKIYHRILLA